MLRSGSGSTKTRRLELRPYLPTDYKCWAQGCRSRKPAQNAFDQGPPPAKKLTRSAYMSWLRSKDQLRKRDLQYVYGVFDRKSGEHLGTIDFFVLGRLAIQIANLGYQIHNHHWGKGYGKEAVKAALVLAFRHLKLHRLEAGIERDNRASIAVAKAIGARREGTRKKSYFDGKHWIDIEMFVIHSEDVGVRMKPSVRTNIRTYWRNEAVT